MLKEEYNKLLDWLEDFISSGQAEIELGNHWDEVDLEKYLKDNFEKIWHKVNFNSSFNKNLHWKQFYTLFFKKEKYIIENNVLKRNCLRDLKKADDIPDTVTEIGRDAFYHCSSLMSISIPNSVTSIGEYAFCDVGITNITIPNNVKTIGKAAFYGCQNLTSIIIGDGVRSIDAQAFLNCPKLTTIIIPNGVTKIENYLFFDCNDLISITIPNNIKIIGREIFSDRCTNLQTINFNGTKEEWTKIDKAVNWRPADLKINIHCSDGNLEV